MRMALKNNENDVEISFKTVEKEDEKVDNIQCDAPNPGVR